MLELIHLSLGERGLSITAGASSFAGFVMEKIKVETRDCTRISSKRKFKKGILITLKSEGMCVRSQSNQSIHLALLGI